jgi:hypothetical protein
MNMSIEKWLDRADDLSEDNYMWQGFELRTCYGATEDMMQEFWELVDKRIDSNYMKEYEKDHIAHEESCNERDLTYISLCGVSVDRQAVEDAIDELEIEDENIEEWLEIIVGKLTEVIGKVNNDMNKIQGEIISKYNLIYVDAEDDD